MGRRSGLGRGIEALIPTVREPEGVELQELAVDDIDPNVFQPRVDFDEETIEGLAESIGQLGVLQPILVRPRGDRFELVAGERRWRAAKRAGLETIPALVREIEDRGSLEQALVENLHREDLNPLEEAAAYELLVSEFDLTQEQVAERVGKSRPAVANTIRLLQLPPELQQLLVDGRLSAGHGRALLALASASDQKVVATKAVSHGWTVRRLEEEVRRLVEGASSDAPAPRPTPPRPAAVLEVEEQLADLLETRVRVEMGRRRGKVVIEVADLDDLGRVYEILRSHAEG